MTPEFFAALPYPNTQQEVLQRLIDLLLETQRSKVVAMVKEIIFKVRNSSRFSPHPVFSQCSTSWVGGGGEAVEGEGGKGLGTTTCPTCNTFQAA